jgi:hypothetical protein
MIANYLGLVKREKLEMAAPVQVLSTEPVLVLYMLGQYMTPDAYSRFVVRMKLKAFCYWFAAVLAPVVMALCFLVP